MAEKRVGKARAAAAAVEVPKPAFLGSADGITAVEVEGGGYAVAFDFDRQLSAIMRGVPGAEFDKADNVFTVPAASVEALGKAVNLPKLRRKFLFSMAFVSCACRIWTLLCAVLIRSLDGDSSRRRSGSARFSTAF